MLTLFNIFCSPWSICRLFFVHQQLKHIKNWWYLCYHHTGPYIPSVYQNVNCNHLGQYVIIYNERKETSDYPSRYSDILVLELCYVQIYGIT